MLRALSTNGKKAKTTAVRCYEAHLLPETNTAGVEYSSGMVFYNDDHGYVGLPAGNSTLEFVAVNKNPASSDYTMAFDYFELITLEGN